MYFKNQIRSALPNPLLPYWGILLLRLNALLKCYFITANALYAVRSDPIWHSIDCFLVEILMYMLVLQRAHLTHSNSAEHVGIAAATTTTNCCGTRWLCPNGSSCCCQLIAIARWQGSIAAGTQIRKEFLFEAQRILVLNEGVRDLHGRGCCRLAGWHRCCCRSCWCCCCCCCGPIELGCGKLIAAVVAAVVAVATVAVVVVWAGVRGFCNR